MNKTTKVLKTSSIAILFAIMASGCSFYKSQVTQMPLISQKGELVAEASIDHVACAYGLTDHIAVQLSTKPLFANRHQAMVGWYTPVGTSGVFEMYGGYAYERCSYFEGFEDITMRQDGNAHVCFMQADIGMPSYRPEGWNKVRLTGALGLRAGGVFMDYTQIDYILSKTLSTPKTVTEKQSLHNDSRFALQPMVKVGLGSDRWKVELGAMYLWMSGDNDPLYDHYGISLNLTYRLPLKLNL